MFVPGKVKKKESPKHEETKVEIQEESPKEATPTEVEEEKFSNPGRR